MLTFRLLTCRKVGSRSTQVAGLWEGLRATATYQPDQGVYHSAALDPGTDLIWRKGPRAGCGPWYLPTPGTWPWAFVAAMDAVIGAKMF